MGLDDYASFAKINSQLLNPPTPLKHVPLRIYIPSSPPGGAGGSSSGGDGDDDDVKAQTGDFKVMQALVSPRLPNREYLSCTYLFFFLCRPCCIHTSFPRLHYPSLVLVRTTINPQPSASDSSAYPLR